MAVSTRKAISIAAIASFMDEIMEQNAPFDTSENYEAHLKILSALRLETRSE